MRSSLAPLGRGAIRAFEGGLSQLCVQTRLLQFASGVASGRATVNLGDGLRRSRFHASQQEGDTAYGSDSIWIGLRNSWRTYGDSHYGFDAQEEVRQVWKEHSKVRE